MPDNHTKPIIQPGSVQSDPALRITVTEDGPYVISGAPPLRAQTIVRNEAGESWDYADGQAFPLKSGDALCRCGHSAHKPFCDGSHETAGEDLAERANRGPMLDGAEHFDGPDLDLADRRDLCAVARFCHNGQSIWKEVKKSGQDHRDLSVIMAHRCPSGRLVLFGADNGVPVEEAFAPSMALLQDPEKGVSGPLYVRGGIVIESVGGDTYEVRNRQALCRCGKSGNKPFCDGSHIKTGFRDGLA